MFEDEEEPKMKKRVLVIDDEEAVVKPIEYILRLYNYEPSTATQWTDALVLLQTKAFDLITLDLEMLTIDGPTMLKFIRETGDTTPVVVISASITERTPDELAEFDASAFVYKPFRVSHIKEVIEGIIGESEPKEIPPDDEPEARSQVIESVTGADSPLSVNEDSESEDLSLEDLLQGAPKALASQKEGVPEIENEFVLGKGMRRRHKRRNRMFKSPEQRNQTLIAMAVIALISLFLSGFMEAFKRQIESMF